jgi:hypothetical protein
VLERKVVPAAHASRKSIVFFSEAYESAAEAGRKSFIATFFRHLLIWRYERVVGWL